MLSKETLRKEIKKHLKEVPPAEFRFQGDKAAALLRFSQIWASYKTVFLFLSMNSEIDTQALLEAALQDGKKVFAPRVEMNDNLVFYPILSSEGPWRKGPFDIKEPPDGKGIDTKDKKGNEYFPALILTPGLAFDMEGRRMGRGRGYYDRFFAELDREGKQYYPLGLCMDFQLVEEVPVDEYDKKVRSLLTCNELYMTP